MKKVKKKKCCKDCKKLKDCLFCRCHQKKHRICSCKVKWKIDKKGRAIHEPSCECSISYECKFCMNMIEVKVVNMGHDINIEDTKHDDNFITITRAEAKFIMKELKKIL